MSEIEKMYENAGIKAKWKDKRVKNTKTYYTEEQAKYLRQIIKNRNIQLLYPPFTAEKQLELIKWLAKTGDVCRIDATVKNEWFVENEVGYSKCFAKFEEALANVINIIWEYMPEIEKQQVRGILE